MKLWQVLPRFDGRASLSTWLYTIARNTFLTALSQQARRRTLPLEEIPDRAALPSATQDGGACDVRRLVAGLPEAQRRVVTLFYLEECSLHEVAGMLDMPEGTVKSHLHRARRALAAAIEAQEVR